MFDFVRFQRHSLHVNRDESSWNVVALTPDSSVIKTTSCKSCGQARQTSDQSLEQIECVNIKQLTKFLVMFPKRIVDVRCHESQLHTFNELWIPHLFLVLIMPLSHISMPVTYLVWTIINLVYLLQIKLVKTNSSFLWTWKMFPFHLTIG